MEETTFEQDIQLVTAKQAEVFNLEFGEGLSNTEIAKRLGISLNSVKTRKKLGNAAIKAHHLKLKKSVQNQPPSTM